MDKEATLRVVDNEGGVSTTRREIVVSGEPAECATGETRVCGDTASAGVGACRAGSEVCVGGRWDECTGVIAPGAEVCGSGADEDCDGEVDESGCGTTPDGGDSADGGLDRLPAMGDDGCGCVAPGAGGRSGLPALLLLLGALGWRRR